MLVSLPTAQNGLFFKAADLAKRAGALKRWERQVRERAPAWLLARHQQERCLDPIAMDLLLPLDPAAALRILRRTRASRRDRDADPYGMRAEFEARALEALHRPGRALEVYRRMLGKDLDEGTRERVVGRMKVLESM